MIFKKGDVVIRQKDGKKYIVSDELFEHGTFLVECHSFEPDGSKIRLLDSKELTLVPKKTLYRENS